MNNSEMRMLDQVSYTRRRGTVLPLTIASITLLLVVITMGALIVHTESSSRSRDLSTFAARGATSAAFVSTVLSAQADREQLTALQYLSGRVTPAQFDLVAGVFGSHTALLFDADGRVLASDPADPSLIGHTLGPPSANLSAAESGRTAISGRGALGPASSTMAAISVPFPATGGRRVFSLSYPVSGGTLAAFVRHATVQPRHNVFLVDENGNVLASSPTVSATTIGAASPALAAAAAHHRSGTVTLAGVLSSFVVAPIAGTQWRFVLAVPNDELYAGTEGSSMWVPWLVFGIVAALALGLLVLFSGFLADRRRMSQLSAEILQIARTDPLTGLPNRRQLADSLHRSVAHFIRYKEPMSMLMIDLDHFKEINDSCGHDAGDRVLRAVAACLRQVLRDSDLYGRWGGDEFLAVLSHTPIEGAREAAQRLCDCVAALDLSSIGLTNGVSLSIGCAPAVGDVTQLLHDADGAMYAAKRAGRGSVFVASAPFPSEPAAV